MEHTTEHYLATPDQTWKDLRNEAATCPSYDLLSLANRTLACWKSAVLGYRAMSYARLSREQNRSLARDLRDAEQAIVAVAMAVLAAQQEGHTQQLYGLISAMRRCHFFIALPIAKRIADNDDQGRDADKIAWLLAQKAQFVDGRLVIDEALAADLPSPYKVESASA